MKIYIILVTCNGAKWIRKCVETALRSDCTIELVVVDNNSTDDTLEIIRSLRATNIKIFETGENLGFGKANNYGIEYALKEGAEYIYLLNQDAYLEPNTLSSLITCHKNDNNLGVLSPMQYNGDGTKLDLNFEKLSFDKSVNDDKNPDVLITDFVMAAHWLIPVDIIKTVGIFNPVFKHYGEDADYVNRVRYFGHKIAIIKNAIGYHDRESRKVTAEKEIKIGYMSYLAVLIDPNRTTWEAIRRFFTFVIKDIGRRIKRRQFTVLNTHIIEQKYLFANFFRIISSRKQNNDKIKIGI